MPVSLETEKYAHHFPGSRRYYYGVNSLL